MKVTFNEVVEEVKQLSFSEKQELETLIRKFLIEERRNEIYENYVKDKEETYNLKSYDDVDSFLTDLNK